MPFALRTLSHSLGQILTRTLLAFLCIATLLKPAASAVPSVAYTVAITKPATASLAVTMTFTPTSADSIDVCIPKWSPGWYVLLNTPANITGVTAAQDGAPLTLAHPTPAQWTLTPTPGKPVTVQYTVKTETKGLGFFHAAISENHAFIPGTTTLMYMACCIP